jgi:hypothetical protein
MHGEAPVSEDSLVRPLFEGPLDIVGDVHGEIEALEALLWELGYDGSGNHAEGRRLVFLGDLCDRGPDSPAVIDLVRGLVQRERAQCVLGNHELNLLREDDKHGNRWHLDPSHPEQRGAFAHCRAAPTGSKATWHAFFLSLPLALERADLRVVHAAWHEPSIVRLRDHRSPLGAYEHHHQQAVADLERSGLLRAAEKEARAHPLETQSAKVPLLENLARKDELVQMSNPVRVVTSGVERAAEAPFWASGKWRMCDRVRWWDEYDPPTPVVVGHYWRDATGGDRDDVSGGKPDLFAGIPPEAWFGRRENVFCVDFSVGGRFLERARGARPFTTRLAAMRWPERTLTFDPIG